MSKRYCDMTKPEINQLLKETSKSSLSNADKLTCLSEYFLGTPYDLYCEQDGPYALYETNPLVNFEKTNCICMVEVIVAMALSSHYEEFFNVLMHLRYRHGLIGMATRNHYTITDWLPANRWCLKEAVQAIGQSHCQPLTRTISHKNFFASKGITDIEDMLPDRTQTIQYVPTAELLAIRPNLKNGDIVSIIMDKPGIFSAHVGFIVIKNGQIYFRHASMSAMEVVEQKYEDYVKDMKRLGLFFMRIREDVQWEMKDTPLHGKIKLSEIQDVDL